MCALILDPLLLLHSYIAIAQATAKPLQALTSSTALIRNLFAALDRAEEVLSSSRYLCGSKLTEADVRLFVTLIRFDPVGSRSACCYVNVVNGGGSFVLLHVSLSRFLT